MCPVTGCNRLSSVTLCSWSQGSLQNCLLVGMPEEETPSVLWSLHFSYDHMKKGKNLVANFKISKAILISDSKAQHLRRTQTAQQHCLFLSFMICFNSVERMKLFINCLKWKYFRKVKHNHKNTLLHKVTVGSQVMLGSNKEEIKIKQWKSL